MTNRKSTKDVEATVNDAAKDIADTAKAELSARGETVKDTAADRAEQEAEQMRRAGEAFDGNPFAREAAHHIAENLSSAAHALREADLSSIQHDVADFARRNPLVFFGGAAAVGFLAARALKASERAEPATVSQHRLPDQSARVEWGQS
ncbi:hypothetical protein A8B78_08875 [Jannaschia sp. EhC01]|nr:hypothetical protein A8B78_08875 [Jannaschia sp. EhC01]